MGIIASLIIWIIVDGRTPMQKQPIVNETEAIQTERVSVVINTDVTDIVEKVADTVVGVTNLQCVRDIWSSSEMTKETGYGSGVIIKTRR